MSQDQAPLRVGTRASLLARTQSGHVADALRAAWGGTGVVHGEVAGSLVARRDDEERVR